MMMKSSLAIIATVVLPILSAEAQSLFDSPELYFGGPGTNSAYLDWASGNLASKRYNSSLFLPSNKNPTNGVAVHWKISQEVPDLETIFEQGNETMISAVDRHTEGDSSQKMIIHLAIAAPASGWVAFGLSENGGMHGSDVVAFETAKPDILRDLHILDSRSPIDDVCNNWVLVDSHILDGFIIFEATRKLDTEDPQDRVIVMDKDSLVPAHRIIASWGDAHEVGYHGDNSARGAVRWFGYDENDAITFQRSMEEYAEGSFVLKANNHTLKPIDTDYVEFCLSLADMMDQTGLPESEATNLTIVGIEPVVDPRTAEFVHHFTVYMNPEDNNDGSLVCDGGHFFEMIYVWAPGEAGFALPTNVGVPYRPGVAQSFRMQVHYNNPQMVKGAIDDSGVRFYYSNKPREHEMGILRLGDPQVELYGNPVGKGITSHSFECNSGCSSTVLQDEPVTAMREYLHMHKTGVQVSNEHYRNGELIKRTDHIDFFDFRQQGNQPVQQQPFEIRPGDSFRTTCSYNSDRAASGSSARFGLSSSDEMCIAFIFYYPRKKMINNMYPWFCVYNVPTIPECDAPYTQKTLNSLEDLQALRTFGPAPEEGTCPTTSPTGSTNTNADSEDSASEDSSSASAIVGSLLAFSAPLVASLPLVVQFLP